MLLVLQRLIALFCVVAIGSLTYSFSACVSTKAGATQANKSPDRERDRAYARQQFTKNFRDLQVTSQNLLKEHEEKRLTQKRLAKDIRIINKAAKALRSLMALGNLAEPVKIDKEINTSQQFDESIRRIAKLIYDFAHNPIHQNSKVFNTDQAQQAQTDLLAIIDLSKAIENKAKIYTMVIETVQ